MANFLDFGDCDVSCDLLGTFCRGGWDWSCGSCIVVCILEGFCLGW